MQKVLCDVEINCRSFYTEFGSPDEPERGSGLLRGGVCSAQEASQEVQVGPI